MRRPVILVFLSMLSLAIVSPVLPYRAIELGATPFMVGLLMAFDTVMLMFTAFFWGRLSDKIGRKPMILIALAVEPVAYAILALGESYMSVLLARGLAGLGAAAIPVLQAYIADETDHGSRTRGMAHFNGAWALAFVVGPLMAFVLGDLTDDSHVVIAWVATGITVITLGLAAYLLRKSVPVAVSAAADAAGAGNPAGEVAEFAIFEKIGWRAIMVRACGLPILAMTLLALVWGQLEGTVGLWSDAKLGWGTTQLSLGYLAAGVAGFVTQLWLTDRASRLVGLAPVAVGATVAVAVVLILPVVWPTSWALLLAMTLAGGGAATANSCYASIFSKATSPAEQGAVMGLCHTGTNAAWIVGPMLGGFAYAAWSPSAPFLIGLVAAFVAAGLFVVFPLSRAIDRATAAEGVQRNA
jgi:MFS family permease